MPASDHSVLSLDDHAARSAEAALDGIVKARAAIGAVIFGQGQVVEEVLVSILSGGHGLLVGLPGLAKTKLVDTLGIVLGLESRRVQFTPDLMPADILGSEVLEESIDHRRAFRFVKGPIFTQLLMADEINRASPRTQSALLQAMQELHVTVAGGAIRFAAALPRAGDPEPDRAGRHLSPARSATRSLPHADRRALSRSSLRKSGS